MSQLIANHAFLLFFLVKVSGTRNGSNMWPSPLKRINLIARAPENWWSWKMKINSLWFISLTNWSPFSGTFLHFVRSFAHEFSKLPIQEPPTNQPSPLPAWWGGHLSAASTFRCIKGRFDKTQRLDWKMVRKKNTHLAILLVPFLRRVKWAILRSSFFPPTRASNGYFESCGIVLTLPDQQTNSAWENFTSSRDSTYQYLTRKESGDFPWNFC